MPDAQILWRRLDAPGHETAWLRSDASSWLLLGTAIFADGGEACRLDYRVRCDRAWRTLTARIRGWIGTREVITEIESDAAGSWRLNGQTHPAVQGCTDVDLSFSPSTNLLPIRRLSLDVGDAATVRAAWLRLPDCNVEPLEQVYRRTGTRDYRFESGGGGFVADLQTNEVGFVTRYPGLWQAEPA